MLAAIRPLQMYSRRSSRLNAKPVVMVRYTTTHAQIAIATRRMMVSVRRRVGFVPSACSTAIDESSTAVTRTSVVHRSITASWATVRLYNRHSAGSPAVCRPGGFRKIRGINRCLAWCHNVGAESLRDAGVAPGIAVGNQCGEGRGGTGDHKRQPRADVFGQPSDDRCTDGGGSSHGDHKQGKDTTAHLRGRRQLQPRARERLVYDAAR